MISPRERGFVSPAMKKRLRRVRRQLAKLALLLVSTMTILVLAEFVVRFLVARGITASEQYPADRPMPNLQVHQNPEVGYLPPPHMTDAAGKLVTNRSGFREKDYSADELRMSDVILNLGDSITFGSRVKASADVYSHQLEQAIGSSLQHRRVIVYNAGVAGFNTWQELALMGELLPTMDVKLVLLGFCLNDSSPRFHVKTDLKGAVSRYDRPIDSFKAFFSREFFNRSYFYVLLKETFKNVQRAHPRVFPASLLWHNLLIRGKRWQECKETLVVMRDQLRTQGIPLVIAVFPYRHQLSLEPQSNLIQNDLMTFCREHGLYCLDLFSAFKEHMSEINFDDEGEGAHPDENGHRVAAQAIFDYLREQELFPFCSLPRNAPDAPEKPRSR
jgi:lysophospholipase L1-like esterase